MRRREFLSSAAAVAALLPARQLFAAQMANLERSGGELVAKTLAGADTVLHVADVEALAASVRGAVVLPGQAAYDGARRVWNGMYDKRPALIVRCTGAADVREAVNFARAHELLTAVRGGGHSFSGKSTCDGGIVIDLSSLDGVSVDPVARIARADGGALLGQLDHETRAYGLVTTTGTVSHTGAAGLTLGGGFGRLCRRYGLACDNLRAVDIVTADGRFLRASDDENADLFWGLRGGGGNFGVATSFEYRLHATNPVVLGGNIGWPADQMAEAFRNYVEFTKAAPDELNLDAFAITPGPTAMFVAEACWCGDHARGEQVLAPLRRFGKPAFDQIGPVEYVKLQQSSDEGNAIGRRYYAKSAFLPDLTPGVLENLSEAFLATPAALRYAILVSEVTGAVARVEPDATAFPNRGARYWVALIANYTDPAEDEARMAVVRDAWKPIEPHTDGFYTNLISDVPDAKVRSNYGRNYDRLVTVKNKYDPTNQFRLNANVLPRA
jgi:FAD binding domain/Berberine and berberine like